MRPTKRRPKHKRGHGPFCIVLVCNAIALEMDSHLPPATIVHLETTPPADSQMPSATPGTNTGAQFPTNWKEIPHVPRKRKRSDSPPNQIRREQVGLRMGFTSDLPTVILLEIGPNLWIERDLSLEEEISRPPTRRRIIQTMREVVQLNRKEEKAKAEKENEHKEGNEQDKGKICPRRSSRLLLRRGVGKLAHGMR